MAARKANVKRVTQETEIDLSLNLDGTGNHEISTGIKMLDHFLSQTVKHGRFDLKLTASGDDEHHVTEDVAICLGKAFNEALGEKLGIVRMADATVPMDESLASVAVDLSGRGIVCCRRSLLKMICAISDRPDPAFSGILRHGRPVEPACPRALRHQRPSQSRGAFQSVR